LDASSSNRSVGSIGGGTARKSINPDHDDETEASIDGTAANKGLRAVASSYRFDNKMTAMARRKRGTGGSTGTAGQASKTPSQAVRQSPGALASVPQGASADAGFSVAAAMTANSFADLNALPALTEEVDAEGSTSDDSESDSSESRGEWNDVRTFQSFGKRNTSPSHLCWYLALLLVTGAINGERTFAFAGWWLSGVSARIESLLGIIGDG
jgi:hypothetical protein